MYKRIPATYFNSFDDVYFSVIEFMQECGFSVIDSNALNLFDNNTYVINSYVLQDPNTIHKLCVVLYRDNSNVESICFFAFDDYDNSKFIYEQQNIIHVNGVETSVSGVVLFDSFEESKKRLNRSDLICVYINKSLMFVYVPTNCYVYSHIFSPIDEYGAVGGHMVFYGNFTKYHIGYDKDVIFMFSTMTYCLCTVVADEININVNPVAQSNNEKMTNKIFSLLWLHPEASYTVGSNNWAFWGDLTHNYYLQNVGKCPPPLMTTFDYSSSDKFEVPKYDLFYKYNFSRDRSLLVSQLNNISILMPLVNYIMREPKVLENWSAVGETKLVNLIDLSYINSGEVFIDTGIERDYHRYFVFPAFNDWYKDIHNFIGLAIEIEAKEKLLHSQSQDYLIINLEDSFRNFDRIEIVYEGNNEVEWTYDDLVAVFDTDGVFNLTKDENNKCMVYGLKNEDGESREYRFTCLESCEIISITGYRE